MVVGGSCARERNHSLVLSESLHHFCSVYTQEMHPGVGKLLQQSLTVPIPGRSRMISWKKKIKIPSLLYDLAFLGTWSQISFLILLSSLD